MSTVVSIIIPCYNSGRYLHDALASIKDHQPETGCEVIIINDGSTDPDTLKLLEELHQEGYTVLHQENKGPAAARNTGIRHSQGRFLFFLDSDNKLMSSYIQKGIEVLGTHKDVGVVYGNPVFFGDSTRPRFNTGKFDMFKMLDANYIDICSLIRREVFEDAGFFDEERIIVGHEDWEFWIRVKKTRWQFHYINEVLFAYRITKDSLVNQASQPAKYEKMLQYIYSKHIDVFTSCYKKLYLQYLYYQHDQRKPFRSLFKFLSLKYFQKNRA